MTTASDNRSIEVTARRPKVSVHMITYNHEPFIGQAIESVLGQQTDFDYELVIGEDCSTDATRSVALAYQAQHPNRVRVLCHEVNMGMLRNAATCTAACRGKYLAKLEGDDYWTDMRKLQKQADFLDAHPDTALCYTNAVAFDTDRPDEKQVLIKPGERKPFIDVAELVTGNQVVSLTRMSRRYDMDALPALYFKGTEGDWPLACLLACSGRVAYIDEITGAYRRHAGGVFTRRSDTEKVYRNARTREAVDRMLAFEYHHIMAPRIRERYLEAYHYGMASGEWRFALPAAAHLLRRAIADRCPASEWRPILRALLPSRFRGA